MIDIVEELKKRSILIEVIDEIIDTHYEPTAKKHLRRGAVQSFIGDKLGIESRSSFICRLINERMALKGYTPCIMRGDQCYKNISYKPYT